MPRGYRSFFLCGLQCCPAGDGQIFIPSYRQGPRSCLVCDQLEGWDNCSTEDPSHSLNGLEYLRVRTLVLFIIFLLGPSIGLPNWEMFSQLAVEWNGPFPTDSKHCCRGNTKRPPETILALPDISTRQSDLDQTLEIWQSPRMVSSLALLRKHLGLHLLSTCLSP